MCYYVRTNYLWVVLPASWLALWSPQRLTGIPGGCQRCLAAAKLFLLLDIVVVSSVSIEVFSVRSAARLVLAFVLNVACQTFALYLDVFLGNTAVSKLRVSLLFWINVHRNWLGRLLAQVELAVGVEVVVVICADWATPINLFFTFFIAGPLAVGAFFLYDKLLAAICINCIYLLQLAGWLGTCLGELWRVHLLHSLLVLLVLFKSFFWLIGSQFRVGCALGKIWLRLCSRIFILYRSSFYNACLAALTKFLAFNWVLVLTRRKHSVAHTARIISQVYADVLGWVWNRTVDLMMRVQDHVLVYLLLHSQRLWHSVLIVFLAVISRKLVFILQKRILVVVALLAELMHGRVCNTTVTTWSCWYIRPDVRRRISLGLTYKVSTFARGVNFINFGAALVQLGGPGIWFVGKLVTLCHRVG